MAETKISTTAQELFELPDNGKHYELVGGELRDMVPAGARHGRAAMKECVPRGGPPEGYWDLAPDIAVEVVSPNDTAAGVQSKV